MGHQPHTKPRMKKIPDKLRAYARLLPSLLVWILFMLASSILLITGAGLLCAVLWHFFTIGWNYIVRLLGA